MVSVCSFSPASHRTRRCLETCQAIGYPICLIMAMATAVCPGIAWHSGTASAVCRHHCTTRPWVPRRLISAAPCVMTPCGSCMSGSKGRPTAGSRGSTATWPVPRPWSTCQSTPCQATPSPPRLPTAPCPCTAATLRCEPTTWTALIPRFPLLSTEETWALTDGTGLSSTRSVKAHTNAE